MSRLNNHQINSIREMRADDISQIVAYSTGFDERYNRFLQRGPDAIELDPNKMVAGLTAMIDMPVAERKSTNIILEQDGAAIGHAVLVKINSGHTGVMHFHIWRGKMQGKSLGQMLNMARPLAESAIRYFFSTYYLQTIIGEPAAKNPLPNRILNSLGLKPIKTYETYVGPLGGTLLANRYEIPRSHFNL